jgi:type I restriction enzyme M protein
MNMLLHGVKDNEFNISHGDSLTNEWGILRETNPAKKMHFDAITRYPIFSFYTYLGLDYQMRQYEKG